MEFISSFMDFGGSFFSYAIPFLFVLTIVVFFHELGHFWVARRCGVKVEAFAVGFGPELLGFNDRHGTRWKLCAIPLGGYVRFHGDDSAASTPDTEALPRWTRRKKHFLLPSAGAQPLDDRRGRPDRQFHSRDRHLLHDLHDLWAAGDDAARRYDSAGECGRGSGLPAGRSHPVDRRPRPSRISATCSAWSAPVRAWRSMSSCCARTAKRR
jgi:hypothetical protein